jgi:hypothetical protein
MSLLALRSSALVWRLAGLLLAPAGLAQVPAQSAAPGQLLPTISIETYNRILGLIFEPQQSTQDRIIFSLIVRTVPAFRPESQVSMYLLQDRSAKVEFAVAERNVYYSSNEAFRSTGEGEAGVLARKIVVKRHTIKVHPDRVLEWQRGLFTALGPTLKSLQAEPTDIYERHPIALVLDGDTRDLWYTQGSKDIHFRIPEAASRSAFDNWAAAVREAVSKMAENSAASSDSPK